MLQNSTLKTKVIQVPCSCTPVIYIIYCSEFACTIVQQFMTLQCKNRYKILHANTRHCKLVLECSRNVDQTSEKYISVRARERVSLLLFLKPAVFSVSSAVLILVFTTFHGMVSTSQFHSQNPHIENTAKRQNDTESIAVCEM